MLYTYIHIYYLNLAGVESVDGLWEASNIRQRRDIYIINYICSSLIEYDLVGGFKHFLLSIIYGIILPIDELIFFKMVKTTNQIIINHH